MASRAVRTRTLLPPCYYEGFMEKRSFKDKTSRRLWTCLYGNSLHFFNDKKDAEYVEKLDLSGFIAVTDDNSLDRNLDAARFNLLMKDGLIKFTVPSAEARELWKGFIQSVSELSVPSSLNLLPGQIHMLREAIDSEKERMKNVGHITVQENMPSCYHSVSRLEAELLLEREAQRGNLLLRPGRDGSSFAVTTRQDLDGPVFRHYRVSRKHDGGFLIDVDNPVPCTTLHDVINFLVEKTDGVLIPLSMEEHYEKNISFIRADNENGEKSVQQAVTSVPPIILPKPVAPRIPTPEPKLVSFEEESEYMNDSLEEETQRGDSLVVPPPQPDKNTRKKVLMPPVPAPRKWAPPKPAPSSASTTNSQEVKLRVPSESLGQIPLQALTELKLKLVQKGRSTE